MLFDYKHGDLGHVYDACGKDIRHPYYPRRGDTETGLVVVLAKDEGGAWRVNTLPAYGRLGDILEFEVQFHAPLTYVPWTQELDGNWPEVATMEWLEEHKQKGPSCADIAKSEGLYAVR